MAVAERVTEFDCPTCTQRIAQEVDGPTACVACGWRGEALLFRPSPVEAEKAQDALPDDAACAHHPHKRAEAICEGTGDYICALCAVELDGGIYSAQYLDKAGKDKLDKDARRYVERPDRQLTYAVVLTVLFWPLFFVTVPVSVYYFIKMARLRQHNELFRRLVGPLHFASAVLIIIFFAAGIVIGIGAIIVSAL